MNDKTKILFVEHEPGDLEMLESELKKGGIHYISETVQSEKAYGNALRSFIPDIILSGNAQPSFDGPAAFKLREQVSPETPFIFVSGIHQKEGSPRLPVKELTQSAQKNRWTVLTAQVKGALKESKDKQEKKRVEKEQIQGERRLARAQQVAHIGSWEFDFTSDVVQWSDEACRIYGLGAHQNQQSFETWLSFVHPGDRDFARSKIQEVLDMQQDSSFNFRFIKKDGTTRYGTTEWRFEFDKGGKPVRLYGILQDVTEVKAAEEKIVKAGRLYALISQVNQNIVRVKDEVGLFHNSCRIVCEFGKFKMAWIGMFDTQQKTITLVDRSGLNDEDVGLFTNAPYQDNGPQDCVLRTGTYYVCNDIENDLKLENWKLFASQRDIRSCMIIPIRKSDQIIGSFNVYAGELNYFDKEEITLMVEVAGDISFALDLFEKARKQSENEKRITENEGRFRALIEKSMDMITLVKEDGELIYCSPSIINNLGYSLDELLHKPDNEFIHPDDLSAFKENIQKILTTPGQSFQNQQRVLHKDGHWLWCEGIVTNLLHEPGVHALVSNFRDISEKKKMEKQLEFDRSNLNALINNTNDLMWSVDRDFKLITSNQAFDKMVTQLSGYKPSRGSSIFEGESNDEQMGRFKKNYERAFAGESFTEIEYNYSPVDFWSEISYYPIYEEARVVGTACFSRNITERKKAENHLQLLESVITNTNDSVLITESEPVDEPGPKIVYVNQAFTKMTGYESAEVVGKTPRLLQGPKSSRQQLDKIREAMVHHQSVEVEIINYKKNGEEFWNNFAVVPVTDKEGRYTHSVSIQRDVTARNRLEEFTRKKLEKQVAERTNELYEALKKEKELVEIKNKFVAIASHEFRTPLSTISLAAESIRNYFHQLTAKEIQRKLIKIEDQASHMTNLLEDILTVGKADAGKIIVNRISLDLKAFINSLIAEILATRKEKRVIHFTFSCASPKVNADDKLLRNVFTNLITNALKFSADDMPVTLTVSDLRNDILIEVTDQGIGIAEEELDSVFESFQRGSNAAAVQGTGLGLSILKKAVELMGGSISVKSKVNKGSTFSVLIPMK